MVVNREGRHRHEEVFLGYLIRERDNIFIAVPLDWANGRGETIVATDLATHTQVLDDSTAILCEPTPESLGAAMAKALGDREGSASYAEAAHAKVEAEYSPAAFERKFVEAYEWIASGS